MIHQIVQTGLVLSILLLIPGAMKDEIDPPYWLQVIIVVGGVTGWLMAFFGLLVLIWS